MHFFIGAISICIPKWSHNFSLVPVSLYFLERGIYKKPMQQDRKMMWIIYQQNFETQLWFTATVTALFVLFSSILQIIWYLTEP